MRQTPSGTLPVLTLLLPVKAMLCLALDEAKTLAGKLDPEPCIHLQEASLSHLLDCSLSLEA